MKLKILVKKPPESSENETPQANPFSIKIAVDNQLPGLEKQLRNLGFKNVLRPPSFWNLPDKTPCPHKRCRNQISRKTAITRWLNENSCKVFVTNNWDDFLEFSEREYGLIGVESNLMKDYELLAKKIKILFMNARHPYVKLFPPGSVLLLSKRKKLLFPKVNQPKKRTRK